MTGREERVILIAIYYPILSLPGRIHPSSASVWGPSYGHGSAPGTPRPGFLE